MCGRMADIQSATTELGEEKKERKIEDEEETTGQKHNVRICYVRRS